MAVRAHAGLMPVVASARRLKDPVLVLQPPEDIASSPMVWKSLRDISDYHQPLAPGALLKCAVIALGLVNPDSTQELDQQLNFNVGGGIEVRMKSTLPQGSGLGTSSVLSCALLAAICTAVGYEYDTDSIVHSVLILEQLLTTGGGWQDQVGGLLPGFKYSVSPDAFPVRVITEDVPVSEEFVERFNHRLIAIYTGRQRLARSLLQDVIRHWYAREPTILQAVRDLRENSVACKEALQRGDLEAVGACLSKYWQSKKTMAPQSEPQFVVQMREALGDLILGSSLAGAGGGGFFLCLTKEADQIEEVKRRLSVISGAEEMMFMRAQINMQGLQVTVGDEELGNPLVK